LKIIKVNESKNNSKTLISYSRAYNLKKPRLNQKELKIQK
jgi:hypothetical protein